MNLVVGGDSSSSELSIQARLNLSGRDDLVKSASYPTMNHRVNSIIHLVSAFYWALGTALVALFGPYPFYSIFGFRLWVSAGIGLVVIDLLAGVKQWRSPAAGRVLSIVLHLAVTIFIVSLMTFEYLQAKPKSLFVWLKADNYWFVAALGLVRLWIGTALLLANKDTH